MRPSPGVVPERCAGPAAAAAGGGGVHLLSGPMARCVADLALALDASRDPQSCPPPARSFAAAAAAGAALGSRDDLRPAQSAPAHALGAVTGVPGHPSTCSTPDEACATPAPPPGRGRGRRWRVAFTPDLAALRRWSRSGRAVPRRGRALPRAGRRAGRRLPGPARRRCHVPGAQ